ncbi:TIGR00730 family Rossman fold protein [Rothia sp. LK2588]|uniref:TIGR00730 family Rossman fold protein n=1 Tax=Rothia sp. LK2588 TaxID=3114369 RepID=UPI0034CE0DEC
MTSSNHSAVITVSAVVIRNHEGQVLTVRKRGTEGFMLPGGKPEPSETPLETVGREVAEELNFQLTAEQLNPLGTFEEPALNEPDHTVRAHVFLWTPAPGEDLDRLAELQPAAEIAELRWVDPAQENLADQAPLNVNAVFPALAEHGVHQPGVVSASQRSLAVFLGSSQGSDPKYAEAARSFGALLAERQIRLVYGGGRAGLMGEVASAALDAGGEVFGVIPDFLASKEVAFTEATQLEVVGTMHERKARMADQAQAFVALPGGPGTLEEFFEVWTWRYLNRHEKPVALLNVDGFWDPLLNMIESMREKGFVNERYLEALIVAETGEELLDKLGF